MPKTVGFITTKAAPLHAGHIYLCSQAATQVDELYIVLSHDADRFEQPVLSLKNRILWLKNTFRDIPHIHVVYVDETGIPKYPNGWKEWAGLVKAKLPEKIDKIFTSEPKDVKGYNQNWPGTQTVVVDADRKRVPISGTEIRKEPFKHWSFMPTMVREQFLKRVCIIGTESTGKTTLTKLLAKHFQTSWVEEYGRTFCERELFGDETLLHFDDYGTIAAQRWIDEVAATKSANRVLLADTNALITNFYCKLYEGRTNPLVTEYEKLEDYDLILFLNDDVPWVADGLRINSDRSKTRPLLDAYLTEVKPDYMERIRYISGTYQERFNLAVTLIEDLLNESN